MDIQKYKKQRLNLSIEKEGGGLRASENRSTEKEEERYKKVILLPS